MKSKKEMGVELKSALLELFEMDMQELSSKEINTVLNEIKIELKSRKQKLKGK